MTLERAVLHDRISTAGFLSAGAGFVLVVVITAAGVGWLSSSLPSVGLLVVVAIAGMAALAAPSAYWVVAAVIATLTLRGLVGIGALPSLSAYLDIPLAWGALLVALLRTSTHSSLARSQLQWVGALSLVVFVSFAFHPAELARPIVSLALLGAPLALLGAILVDPPRPPVYTRMIVVGTGLAIIQLPFAFSQALSLGQGDSVQGTLYGAGAGAHVTAAVCAVAGIWVLLRPGPLFTRRAPLAVLLFLVPLIADAKQVLFALPAAFLAIAEFPRIRMNHVLVGLVSACSIVALIYFAPLGRTGIMFLERAQEGGGGKVEAARLVRDHVTSEPSALAFGKGPAQTVSRAAFMTTHLMQRQGSPLQVLDLRPAQTAIEAHQRANATSGGGTSFNSGVSSAVGVFGDFGLAGAVAYGGFLGWAFLAVRRRRRDSPEAAAATAALALFALLGFIFDWWEQPPFALYVFFLVGLGLTAPRQNTRGDS